MQMELCMLDDSKSVDDVQYRAMQCNNLLSAAEIQKIRSFRGFQPFLPITWALEKASAPPPAAAPPPLLTRHRACAVRVAHP